MSFLTFLKKKKNIFLKILIFTGEKACLAAKSAVHGCIHYLNKTIFDDISLFEFEPKKSENSPKRQTRTKTEPKTTRNIEKLTEYTLENNENRISNTMEVFICLLRAFNCAHNLILENQGMLTTLTVLVVLPLKPSNLKKTREDTGDDSTSGAHAAQSTGNSTLPRTHKIREEKLQGIDNSSVSHKLQSTVDKSSSVKKNETDKYNTNIQQRPQNSSDEKFAHLKKRDDKIGDDKSGGVPHVEKYVCCACNVGDTLAYVYSQKYGVRELTKGSHDVYCNRDMRDALGALGPVDGKLTFSKLWKYLIKTF